MGKYSRSGYETYRLVCDIMLYIDKAIEASITQETIDKLTEIRERLKEVLRSL